MSSSMWLQSIAGFSLRKTTAGETTDPGLVSWKGLRVHVFTFPDQIHKTGNLKTPARTPVSQKDL